MFYSLACLESTPFRIHVFKATRPVITASDNRVTTRSFPLPLSSFFVGARILLFVAFLLAFGSVIASIWIFVAYYLTYRKENVYPGVCLIGQNLAIFVRSVFVDGWMDGCLNSRIV